MDKLNIVKQAGEKLSATEVNMIASRVDALIDWVNEWTSQHPNAKDISGGLVVGLLSSYTYVNEPIVPNVELYVYGQKLVKGVDYVVKLYNNDGIGTGTMVLEGVGEYTGSINETFGIDGVKYVVTFVTQYGGASKTKISVVTASNLPALTDDNYELEGWYYDAEFNKKVNVGDLLESDTTMFAKWKAKTFSLTYNTNGIGEVVQPTTRFGTLPTLPQPTAEGYYFAGWYFADGSEAKAGMAIYADTILMAKWIDVSVKISINDNSISYNKSTADENVKLYVNNTEYSQPLTFDGPKTFDFALKYKEAAITPNHAMTAIIKEEDGTIEFAESVTAIDESGNPVTFPASIASVACKTITATYNGQKATIKIVNA